MEVLREDFRGRIPRLRRDRKEAKKSHCVALVRLRPCKSGRFPYEARTFLAKIPMPCAFRALSGPGFSDRLLVFPQVHHVKNAASLDTEHKTTDYSAHLLLEYFLRTYKSVAQSMLTGALYSPALSDQGDKIQFLQTFFSAEDRISAGVAWSATARRASVSTLGRCLPVSTAFTMSHEILASFAKALIDSPKASRLSRISDETLLFKELYHDSGRTAGHHTRFRLDPDSRNTMNPEASCI